MATVIPSSDGGFSLMWIDNARGEVGFAVERDPAFPNQFAILPANSTLFVDPEDFPQVRYRVRALGRTAHSEWTGWATGASAAAEFPVLTPSSGFSGPTPQPASVGNASMPGFDAKAIARWDVVPYQTFTGSFHIGVVAFHMNGIDRVEFSANGGPWVPVREMKLNPRTNVWEYTAVLKASDFPDGPVEVRAVAYPKTAGEPRVLESMELFANSGGSLPANELFVHPSNGSDASGLGTAASPYQSIRRALVQVNSSLAQYDGATITLQAAGEYRVDAAPSSINNTRWITIRAAEGLDRNSVVISAGGWELVRPKVGRLRFSGVSLDFSRIRQMYKEDVHQQWYDGCRWFQSSGWATIGSGQTYPVRNEGNYSGLYVTNSVAQDMLYGFVRANLVSGSSAERISGDVFQNSLAVIGCSIRTVDGNVLEHHTDLFQYFGHHNNLIVYGVTAQDVRSTQNFFLDHYQSSFTDCAFVNVAIENHQTNVPKSQLNSAQNHVIFYHVSNPGQPWVFRDDLPAPRQFVGNNVSFRNCVLDSISRGNYNWAGLPSGVTMSGCHIVSNGSIGTETTNGQVSVVVQSPGKFMHAGSAVGLLTGTGIPIWGLTSTDSVDRGAWPN